MSRPIGCIDICIGYIGCMYDYLTHTLTGYSLHSRRIESNQRWYPRREGFSSPPTTGRFTSLAIFGKVLFFSEQVIIGSFACQHLRPNGMKDLLNFQFTCSVCHQYNA